MQRKFHLHSHHDRLIHGGVFDMKTCIKCSRTLPDDAPYCPSCGNPVSFYEEKEQPESRFSSIGMPPATSSLASAQSVTRKQARGRTNLILALVVLGGLLVTSLAL